MQNGGAVLQVEALMVCLSEKIPLVCALFQDKRSVLRGRKEQSGTKNWSRTHGFRLGPVTEHTRRVQHHKRWSHLLKMHDLGLKTSPVAWGHTHTFSTGITWALLKEPIIHLYKRKKSFVVATYLKTPFSLCFCDLNWNLTERNHKTGTLLSGETGDIIPGVIASSVKSLLFHVSHLQSALQRLVVKTESLNIN